MSEQSRDVEQTLVQDSYLAPSQSGFPSGETRNGIPAEEGARRDSRTSGSYLALSQSGCPSGETRNGIPAEEGARRDSRTSGSRTSGSSRLRGDVAIIGMACTYPGARNLQAFWQNVVDCFDAVTDVPPGRWNSDVFYNPDPAAEDRIYCKRGGYLGDSFAFNPLKYGTMPKAVDGAEPDQFIVLRSVYEAMADAGYVDRPINGERTAFIMGRGNYLGAGLSNLLQRSAITEQTLAILKALHPEYTEEHLAQIRAELKAGARSFGPDMAPGLIPNITTGRVANRLDLMGTNYSIDAACASTLIATEAAVRELLTDQCDLVLAGGVHVFTDVPFLLVFSALGALSHTGVCRPFDRDCDGTLPGEGVGVLALKRLADAERDGDRIYAVIKGIGSASDGRAMSVAAPRLEGEELALRRAYDMSGVPPETMGLIEAHGTGTAVGDPTEVEALNRVLGPRTGPLPTCAIGSVKSMIGHAMPAAGAASLIKTALALYHRVLPATLHVRQPSEELTDPKCRLYVNTETRPWIHGHTDHPRRAGVDAFGFGGINAHVVLEEYRGSVLVGVSGKGDSEPKPQTPDPKPEMTLIRRWDSEVCVIEGGTREELLAAVRRLRDYATVAEGVELRDVAYTLNTSLKGAGHRLALVAESTADLASKLAIAEKRLADPGCTQIKDTKGVFYFSQPLAREGKVAFIFPGEGAQYVNMLAGLCIHFPEMRACFDAADRAAQSPDRYPPSLDIFPPPFFSEEEAAEAEARLWRIERATEAVLTADGAMYTLLSRLGLKPDMITGHSAGEWAAMVAAGMIEVDEFVASMSRLDAMYRQLAEDTTVPRMAMLAVGTDRDTVSRVAVEAIADRELRIADSGAVGVPNRDVLRLGSPAPSNPQSAIRNPQFFVANDNCPHQVVVVVEPERAEAVMEHLRAKGIFVERLPYDRGYHTPVFTYICEPLREFFSSLRISPPATPLYSCTTSQAYPQDQAGILDIVSNTFARPLLFRQTIEAMYDDGARVFVEVGPRGNLTAFVDDILRGRPHLTIPTNLHRKCEVWALNQALAMLSAQHLDIRFEHLYERRSPRRLSWDAKADQPVDEDRAPGTIRVPLGYPMMSVSPRDGEGERRREEEKERGGEGETGRGGDGQAGYSALVGDSHPPSASAHILDDQNKPQEMGLPTAPAALRVPSAASQPQWHQPTSMPAGASQVMQEHLQLMEQFLHTQEEILCGYLGSPHFAHMAPATETGSSDVRSASGTESDYGLAPSQGGGSREGIPAERGARKDSHPSDSRASDPLLLHDELATPATVPAPAAVEAAAGEGLEELLVSIVSDKTGYPPEMLGLDLDMEADLGIDSIKRVEILGTLQKMAGETSLNGEIDMEQVAKLKTLRQVAEFLNREGENERKRDGETEDPREGGSLSPSLHLSISPSSTETSSDMPFAGRIRHMTPGQEVVVERSVDLENDMYLQDHRFGPRVSEYDDQLGPLPVVPLTVSIEVMAEVASLLMPGLCVVGVRDIQASRWIDIEKEGQVVPLEITARRAPAEGQVRVAIRRPQPGVTPPPAGFSPVAEGTVLFDRQLPAQPAIEPLVLKNERGCSHTAEEMYGEQRMFHGPRFRGVVSLDAVGDDGLKAQLQVLPAHNVLKDRPSPRFHIDPFLLDAAGQLVGYWPVETCEEGFVLFPIRIRELTLHRESPAAGENCVCNLRVRELQPRTLRADMDVIAPDGQLWMRITGWEDWRFYWPRDFYDFWRFPKRGSAGKFLDIPLPPGHEDAACCWMQPFGEIQTSIWENLWAHLILNRREIAQYHAFDNPRRRSEWIFGRAAAKDAVRAWARRRHGVDLYPADVEVHVDEHGKPFVRGEWTSRLGETPQISISHKGLNAVAVAACSVVGIDLETCTRRDEAFEAAACHECEREILGTLDGLDRDEWITRFWCAKEAAGKAAGRGLDFAPARIMVQSVDPRSGSMRVICPGASEGRQDLEPDEGGWAVQTVRDGEFVLAVAADERNGNGH